MNRFDDLEDDIPGAPAGMPPSQFPPEATTKPPKRTNGQDGVVHSPTQQNAPSASVVALDWPKLAVLTPPERKWAIKGWIGFGHVTLLVGSGGIGKTLLAQQIASCLCLGRAFIEEVPAAFKCLMWACEDDHDELWRRQVMLARWCKAGLEEFDQRLTIVPRHGLDNALVSTDYGKPTFSPLIAQLTEQANDLGSQVVILDNVAQLYGGNENDRHAVTAFLNALAGALPGRAIVLLAHPSRGQGSEFSGSSAWENTARTRLYLGANLPGAKVDPEASTDDTVRYLSRRKANYSPKDWRRMTYADGALTPDHPDTEQGIIGSIRSGKTQRVILDGLQRLSAMGLHGSSGSRSPSFLPRLLIEYRFDEGLPSRDLTEAMRALMTEGKIKHETVGKSQNRNSIKGLVIVA